jgi:type I restriction enzyme R subunit
MFQKTDLAGKCAIVTSYKPAPADIKGEETGEGILHERVRYEERGPSVSGRSTLGLPQSTTIELGFRLRR